MWESWKEPVSGKSVVTLEWLIQYECVSYVSAKDEPYDIVR